MDYLMMQLGDPSRALMGGLGDDVEGQAGRRVGNDRYVFDRARGRGVFDSAGVLVSASYAVPERRQAARETFEDVVAEETTECLHAHLRRAVNEAIEVATRVMITDEAISAFGRAWHAAPENGPPGARRRAALAAALTALGFEVVK